MGRLKAYSGFQKTSTRIHRLHDVTIHAYNENFIKGKELLKKRENRNLIVEVKSGNKIIRYPLNGLTYHSRDVYPVLLRVSPK